MMKTYPETSPSDPSRTGLIELPPPISSSRVSVEEALRSRRSLRDFPGSPLSLAQVGQLLWAAQGVTHAARYRTAPSAGALYPLELYLAAGEVEGLEPGSYRYLPAHHQLRTTGKGDRRRALVEAAWDQSWMGTSSAILVLAAVLERTQRRYGERAERYVTIEIGHAAQNVHLQAETLGLGTVVVGAFHDERAREAIGARAEEVVLALMPVGRR